ncbi:unnamed protein product [Ambrosiozyma monospora]|uniref:Unnamed protein product n=1 Tax=Ambrosiozyma monospora TaxID=43982 RepID=A0A9W7DF18_AMBMO|nr:unnamed protein product [Ambrosiozyma monospora]
MPEADEILRQLLKLSDSERVPLNNVENMIKATEKLGSLIKTSVLIKGGRTPVDEQGNVNQENPKYIINVFYDHITGKTTCFQSHYLNSANTHGTGCSLSSSIASNLAKGESMLVAVQKGLEFVAEGIRHAFPKINGPINHVWAIEDKISVAQPVNKEGGKFNLVEYLINHPDIKPYWHKYTHHEFVKRLVDESLPTNKFEEFIQQDYKYLENYLWIHQKMAELAPTEALEDSSFVSCDAIAHEMEKHKERLAVSHGVKEARKIKPNEATKQYCKYLMRTLVDSGSFLKVLVAVSPCLFGYNHAATNLYDYKMHHDISTGKIIDPAKLNDRDTKIPEVKNKLYREWLEEYCSPEFAAACESGQNALNNFYNVKDQYPGESATLDELVAIFKEGTICECNFWDAYL